MTYSQDERLKDARLRSNKNLKPIKKGEVRNPKGKPRIPDEIKAIRQMSKYILDAKIDEYLDKSIEELEKILKDKSLKTLDHFIGQIVLAGITKGDPVRFDTLLNRRLGKVKERIEMLRPEPLVIHRSNGDQLELTSQLKSETLHIDQNQDDYYDD